MVYKTSLPLNLSFEEKYADYLQGLTVQRGNIATQSLNRSREFKTIFRRFCLPLK